MFDKLMMLLVLALFAAPAMAGETPYGSHAPTLMYWWCQAGSTSYATNPAKVTYYSSNVFENDSAKTHMSQRELGAAFWKFVVEKYDIPKPNQSETATCLAATNTAQANAIKADRLHQLAMSKTSKVIETGWGGG
jgi:hypothetical protein